VLVGVFTAVYLVLFVGTLGKYPKLTVFVFPALHALAFSLLAAIEYKFDAQMYRLELLLNAKARKRSLRLFEGRRNSTTTRQRTMSASAIQTDSASKDAMIELVSASGFAHQLETDRPASPAAAESLKEDSLPATSTSALNALAASGASSTVLMPNHKTPIAVDTGIAGAGTATSSSDVVRRDSHTATADDANKLRRISSQYPEATVLRNTSGRKFLAEQHTFRAVLAHWPRQMLDALLIAIAFLVLLTVRTLVSYPTCGVPLRDVDYFAIPKRENCTSGVWLAAALEDSIVAYVSTSEYQIFYGPLTR